MKVFLKIAKAVTSHTASTKVQLSEHCRLNNYLEGNVSQGDMEQRSLNDGISCPQVVIQHHCSCFRETKLLRLYVPL